METPARKGRGLGGSNLQRIPQYVNSAAAEVTSACRRLWRYQRRGLVKPRVAEPSPRTVPPGGVSVWVSVTLRIAHRGRTRILPRVISGDSRQHGTG